MMYDDLIRSASRAVSRASWHYPCLAISSLNTNTLVARAKFMRKEVLLSLRLRLLDQWRRGRKREEKKERERETGRERERGGGGAEE